jgi:hypothetical protein
VGRGRAYLHYASRHNKSSSASICIYIHLPPQLHPGPLTTVRLYTMAEPVSLGASALAFIVLAGQLSKLALTFCDSVRDAPVNIVRITTRLRDLEQIFIQIGRIRSQAPVGEDHPGSQRYWNDKCRELRTNFAEFHDIVKQWGSLRGPVGRTKWFLSYEPRSHKFLSQLNEDIAVVKSLHQLMMGSYVSIHRVFY